MIIFSSLKASSDFEATFPPPESHHWNQFPARPRLGPEKPAQLYLAIYRGSVCRSGQVDSFRLKKKMKLLTLSTGISGFCFDLETAIKTHGHDAYTCLTGNAAKKSYVLYPN